MKKLKQNKKRRIRESKIDYEALEELERMEKAEQRENFVCYNGENQECSVY